MGRAGYGPKCRGCYGYGFVVMSMGQSGSEKCEPVTSLPSRLELCATYVCFMVERIYVVFHENRKA